MSIEMQAVADKLAIKEVLYRYCRGLDRMDKEMAYSVWHSESAVEYIDMFTGTGPGFVDWVWRSHEGMERHSHQVTNVLIDINGDGSSAVSEAYVTVALWTLPDANGDRKEIHVRGRYLDAWVRIGGRWAIKKRLHVMDMQSIHSMQFGEVNKESTRDGADPSHAFLKI